MNNFLPELLARHRGQRIKFSGDLQAATRESEVVFIAVGTPPTESGDADLSYVESVAREISGGVDGYKVVVEKSTVPVYTSQWIRTIIMRNGADPSHFDVASNPEFLREGTAVTNFLYPDRIVVGVESERAAEVMRQLYGPLTSGWYYGRGDAIPRPEAATAKAPPRLIVTSTQERGTDQARFQRISGDEDFFYQCGGVDLRIGGGECAAGVRRDRDGFADRAAIHESGNRVWRVVLSEGPDGVSGGREGKRIRLPAAGRSDPY